MKQNVGKLDRLGRVVLAALSGLMSLAVFMTWIDVPPFFSEALVILFFGAVSAGLLVSALTGRCGVYSFFDTSTCKN